MNAVGETVPVSHTRLVASGFFCVMMCLAAMCTPCSADTEVWHVKSIEWLTDTSDAIVVADVVSEGTGYRVANVLKGSRSLVGQLIEADTKAVVKTPVILFFRRVRDKLRIHERIGPAAPLLMQWDRATSRWSEEPVRMLAVGKNGDIAQTLSQVTKIIKQRLKDGQTVPRRCDYDAVEARKSFAGGFYRRADGVYECNDYGVYLTVLVPPDEEYREELKKSPQGSSRYINYGNRNRKAIYLANYGSQTGQQ